MSKSNNSVPNKIQALWNILGGDKGVDKLLDGEIGLFQITDDGKFKLVSGFKVKPLIDIQSVTVTEDAKIFLEGSVPGPFSVVTSCLLYTSPSPRD